MIPPASSVVRSLAQALANEGDAENTAVALDRALRSAFDASDRVVVEVEFTGLRLLGEGTPPVDPQNVRSAGRAIVMRIRRIGFTPQVTRAGLHDLVRLLGQGPDASGIVSALSDAAPAGIFLSTLDGDAYRPPPSAASSTPEADLDGMELVEGPTAPASAGPKVSTPAPTPPATKGTGDDPGGMFSLFRVSSPSEESAAETLIESLATIHDLHEFSTVARSAASTVDSLLTSGAEDRAGALIAALIEIVTEDKRARPYRELASSALLSVWRARRPEALLSALIQAGEAEPSRLVAAAVDAEGEEGARRALEAFHRVEDVTLRDALLHGVVAATPAHDGLVAACVQTATPAGALALLDSASRSGVDFRRLLRWLPADDDVHLDVRLAATRTAGSVGTRDALPYVARRLGDRDAAVRMEAARQLGKPGAGGAVPFLSRCIRSDGDEGVRLAAVRALGRIGNDEAIGALAAITERRQLLGGSALRHLKLAAVAALADVETAAARHALQRISSSGDRAVAAAAARAVNDTRVDNP